MRSESGGPDLMGLVSLLEEDTRELSLSSTWGHVKKVAVCRAEIKPSPETKHAGALFLDFSASGTVGKYIIVV